MTIPSAPPIANHIRHRFSAAETTGKNRGCQAPQFSIRVTRPLPADVRARVAGEKTRVYATLVFNRHYRPPDGMPTRKQAKSTVLNTLVASPVMPVVPRG